MLSVLGVQPGNLYELCQLYCSKCSQNFSFKTLEQNNTTGSVNCQVCKTQPLEPIFMLQLLAQDWSLS